MWPRSSARSWSSDAYVSSRVGALRRPNSSRLFWPPVHVLIAYRTLELGLVTGVLASGRCFQIGSALRHSPRMRVPRDDGNSAVSKFGSAKSGCDNACAVAA